MPTRNLPKNATLGSVSYIFDARTEKTAKKWRPSGRAFFWLTSAIASWMLLARLAELIIGD